MKQQTALLQIQENQSWQPVNFVVYRNSAPAIWAVTDWTDKFLSGKEKDK